ncbi:MAG: serine hydroxymethyltransferase [Minisyncoccia bacterium]
MRDKQIQRLISLENKKQKQTINLIASENFVSKDVLKALGSVFTNKYAEGYINKRYYGGVKYIDQLEKVVKERALKLFQLSEKKWDVNVQPYSGAIANLAIFSALVPIGEKIMAMDLNMGGHLSHISNVSFTSKLWKRVSYGVNKKTEKLDYNEIFKIAKKEKPKLIIAGYSSYSRIINFKKFKKIADDVNAFLLVDMSHFAGLVAGKVYPSPFKYADVVMTTTQKTLRGPRGALIFASKKKFNNNLTIADAINKAVFPGLQGGPHTNTIAAIGVCLYEALQPNFKKYAQQVVINTKTLANELQKYGWKIISGGTDTHLFLMDTISKGISGKDASNILERHGIIVNKNVLPFDLRAPNDPSGIRIGTAAVTTQGMKKNDMKKLAKKINDLLMNAIRK